MVLKRPEKPLKILTLDGGGLQAISTLLILDKLLSTIQEINHTPTKPRPCDVFHVITGIGAGGWLAILLGRLQLDVPTCLTEWYNLIDRIAPPRTRTEGFSRRIFKNTYFDEALLLGSVKRLAEVYGTSDKLVDPHPPDTTCQYVFVAGQRAARPSDGEEYAVFRAYNVPEDPDLMKSLRPGHPKPAEFPMSHAFGVTGAARYFSAAWKEPLGGNGKTSFLDNMFPRPHNITLLALEEVWTLFGSDVPISVVVNIGPGFPTDADLSRLARRFSWGRTKPTSTSLEIYRDHYRSNSDERQRSPSRSTRTRSVKRPLGSWQAAGLVFGPRNRKLQSEERALENRINEQLRAHYTQAPPYFRLALDESPDGAALNDARSPGTVLDVTKMYNESPKAVKAMDAISRHSDISLDIPLSQEVRACA